MMFNLRLLAWGSAVVLLLAGGTWAYRAGVESGRAEVQAKFDAYRTAQQEVARKAMEERMEAERALQRQAKEKSDALTKDLQSRDASLARARGELDRLRNALAARPRGGSDPNPAATGPAFDGDTTAGILGECATRLVEVGGQADRLAAQVVGLQDYALTAQRVCGVGGN